MFVALDSGRPFFKKPFGEIGNVFICNCIKKGEGRGYKNVTLKPQYKWCSIFLFYFFLFEMELFSMRDARMLAKLDMAIEELAKRRDAGTISPELADKFYGMNRRTQSLSLLSDPLSLPV